MNKVSKTGLLVISRHAESEWNVLGKWTGLVDVGLSEKGHHEATQIGELLAGLTFDEAYTSEQKRTHQTLAGIVKASQQTTVPHTVTAAFNERDYGDLTGKNKWEVQSEIGEEAFKGIRRGWDYPVPGGETLKDVYGRVVPFFDTVILPKLLAGKNILLVAHGNSIRALIKHLEAIDDLGIADVEMVLGSILMYHFEADNPKHALKEIKHIDTILPNA